MESNISFDKILHDTIESDLKPIFEPNLKFSLSNNLQYGFYKKGEIQALIQFTSGYTSGIKDLNILTKSAVLLFKVETNYLSEVIDKLNKYVIDLNGFHFYNEAYNIKFSLKMNTPTVIATQTEAADFETFDISILQILVDVVFVEDPKEKKKYLIISDETFEISSITNYSISISNNYESADVDDALPYVFFSGQEINVSITTIDNGSDFHNWLNENYNKTKNKIVKFYELSNNELIDNAKIYKMVIPQIAITEQNDQRIFNLTLRGVSNE